MIPSFVYFMFRVFGFILVKEERRPIDSVMWKDEPVQRYGHGGRASDIGFLEYIVQDLY